MTIHDLADRNLKLSRALRQKHESQRKQDMHYEMTKKLHNKNLLREQSLKLYDNLREKKRSMERTTNKYSNMKKEITKMRRQLTKVKQKCTTKQKFVWRLDRQIAKSRAILKELKKNIADIAAADNEQNSTDLLPPWLAEMHDSKRIRCVSRYYDNYSSVT